MRLVVLGVMCLTFLWVVPKPDPAAGDDPIICGWAVTTVCPGCTPSQPEDATCACGANAESCDCVKQSGGIQNSLVIECTTNDFTYSADMNGYVIDLGQEVLCKTISRCAYDAEGHQLGCGGNPPDCSQEPGCHWVPTISVQQRIYVQGARCKQGEE